MLKLKIAWPVNHDFQIFVRISDIRLHLTQIQYGLLIDLSTSIPRVFEGAPEAESKLVTPDPSPDSEGEVLVDLQPELRTIESGDGQKGWATVDLVVTVNAVKLHLYDSLATAESNIKDHGIARFALNNTELRFKMLSDGASEAQVVLKSFTMSNTMPTATKYREIIPAANHDRNQVMVLYTASGGTNGSALAIISIDSPHIVFAVDPVVALLEFVTSGACSNRTDDAMVDTAQVKSKPPPSVGLRIDLHDIAVSVLENDTDPESQAIQLVVNQIMLSQQVCWFPSIHASTEHL
jgi:vacuolar protein sorting-associated protein 13A/C